MYRHTSSHLGVGTCDNYSMSETDKVRLNLDSSLYGNSQDPFLQSEESIPIAELIPQVLLERRSLLNLTEQLLEEEIAQKESIVQAEEEEAQESSQDATEDTESAFQTFQKQKWELLTHVNSALNETSLSLDFVSLLMSAVKPNIAKATISPHLTKTAPLGSLNSDRLRTDELAPSETDKRGDSRSIGLGWKYQSLKHITGLFQGAGSQLREQVEVEHKYWNLVNKVLLYGEVLFKVKDPLTNSRAIGVKYGYGDSGSSYYDKGLAVLRKDEATGDISFNPISTGNHKIGKIPNKFVRVKILSKIDDDYMLTGQSMFEQDALRQDHEDGVINDIEKARYFLFEEDLFYHLTREAKNLINYNVTIISNKIIIDVFDQIVEIESVVYDESNEEELANVYQNTNQESSKNNGKAQAILTFLKLMLCCYYNYNLKLKQKIPTLFTKWKQANSHPLMLRPLIGHIRHEINFRNMATILYGICKSHESVCSSDIVEKKYKNLDAQNVSNSFQKAIETPVSAFNVVLQKKASGECLNVEVEVTTSEIFVNLEINLTVARYKNIEDLKQNQQGSNVLQLKFTDLFGIEESLNWTLMSFLQK